MCWRTPALFFFPARCLLFTLLGCAPRAQLQRVDDALLKVFCGESCSFWSHGKTSGRSAGTSWCTVFCFMVWLCFCLWFYWKEKPLWILAPPEEFPLPFSHLSPATVLLAIYLPKQNGFFITVPMKSCCGLCIDTAFQIALCRNSPTGSGAP